MIKGYKKNLLNLRFNRLLIIKDLNEKRNTDNMWLCRCDCGNEVSVRSSSLINGNTKSCGCLAKENCSKVRKLYGITLEFGESSFNALYQNYEHGAKERNFIFELTKEQFREITQKNCYYCGIEPKQENYCKRGRCNGFYQYNGIDKIDSSMGYTLDNCVPCCFQCNRAKDTYTQEQFLQWIKRIYITQYHKVTNPTPGQLYEY
jgi:hypothetical protein